MEPETLNQTKKDALKEAFDEAAKVEKAEAEAPAAVPCAAVPIDALENMANILARATVDIMGGLPERALTGIRAVIYTLENAQNVKGEAE